MKKKGLLFSVLSVMCVGLTAGCEETPTHKIEAVVNNDECGYITGGGTYEEGSSATLKIYSNKGCILKGVEFLQSSEGTPTTLSFTPSDDGKYHYRTSKVVADTKGKYTAIFEVDEDEKNSVEELSNSLSRKYYIHYNLYPAGTESIVGAEKVPSVYLDTDAALKDGDSDKKSDNIDIVNVNAKLNIKYHENVEGEIEWFTDDSFQNQNRYNFAPVTYSSLDFTEENGKLHAHLYGRIKNADKTSVVKDALDQFKEETAMVVKEEGTEKFAKVLGKVEDGQVNIVVHEDENTITHNIHKGKYYEYVAGVVDSSFDLSEADILLKDIKNIYKYISIKDIDLNSYVVDEAEEATERENVVIGDKTVNCFVYVLKNNEGAQVKIYIYKGKIYKTIIGDDTLLYSYEDKGGRNDSSADNMYLVRLYSSNENLNGFLKTYREDFDKMIKVIPANNQNLTTQMDEDLKTELKKYSYKMYKGAVQNGSCAIDDDYKYEGNSVDEHMNLCLQINASITDLDAGKQRLKEGEYRVTSSLEVFDKLVPSSYDVGKGEDLSTKYNKDNKPENLATVILDAIKQIDSLTHTGTGAYGRFELTFIEEEGKETKTFYSFYSKENSTVPYLSIKLNDEKLIEEVHYYSVDITTGNIITYPIIFDYSLSAVNELRTGNFMLNGSITVAEDEDYLSKTDGTGIDPTLWSLIERLKELNSDIESYEITYNNEDNTYTFKNSNDTETTEDDIVYLFTVIDNKVSSFKYANGAEPVVEYVITYDLPTE